jgi:hypothetical protein
LPLCHAFHAAIDFILRRRLRFDISLLMRFRRHDIFAFTPLLLPPPMFSSFHCFSMPFSLFRYARR